MIRCVAIDDEPIALSIIQEYCRRFGDIELACFTSPIAGMEYVKSQRPDILFLDIEMNSHNGIALATDLPSSICLIFTTAYSEYALDGFNADAVDFLHKPIFYPRFERAIVKALKWMGRQKGNTPGISTITLKSEHKNVVLNLDDILYIEAMDNYVKIFRHGFPMFMSQITMKEMETMLPPDRFKRVHRSFIVAMKAVDRFSNRKIFIHDHDKPIPVGRKYLDSFNKFHNTFKLFISDNQ